MGAKFPTPPPTAEELAAMGGKPRPSPPPPSPVRNAVAMQDAAYVLRWLIQMHECERLTLPANIEALARRAVSVLAG